MATKPIETSIKVFACGGKDALKTEVSSEHLSTDFPNLRIIGARSAGLDMAVHINLSERKSYALSLADAIATLNDEVL